MAAESEKAAWEAARELVADVSATDGAARVRLTGELDLATADELVEVVEQLRRRGHCRVTLDLSDLAFCDLCGLNAMLKVRAQLLTEQGELRVTGAPPGLRRLVEVAGLHTVFDL